MVRTLSSAARCKPIRLGADGARIGGDYLVIVVRTVRTVLSLPKKVEYTDLLFVNAGVGERNGPAERICAGKCAVYLGILAGIAVGILGQRIVLNDRARLVIFGIRYIFYFYC